MNPNLKILGVEIDKERVEAAFNEITSDTRRASALAAGAAAYLEQIAQVKRRAETTEPKG